ncbi:elongation factor 1-gamma (EF-1-gamma) [Trypanosoma cruzi]|uniref:Elongation factor 1-gamma (EF-1-gamma), putative n=1 Tax=Trypanosoma cruzi (strain CL Brener) TaxID=353153 RepID=Q4E490_TRYCC|nr:elongation factor 1-gamma (EF-1-gamma), putative [Trypanosoma cruzi]EAN99583.1 elongation factor 1-gamma (EF-1-gamma), putative [Trypanosoma cruzi]KAF8291909.1 elongation factor 1-gamma (EF-1-gamma) [Trypanosoma cruzi]RNC51656.1 elongation factor 1-gamma (EF-1-gamma) [Trypanosoma cruzi]|eukprot:XP_821434.1 elongation factor 1-gamma (EF-1-gamma) [Trypanosoma cruzi strain CL Brener]
MQCVTANLIGIWLQRMEHVRQYLLGVALMIGEEGRHDIVALCVLWRPGHAGDCEGRGGHGAVGLREEVADVAAQRERMTDCVWWEVPTIPRPVLEGRVLK